ncbi:MAG TPA: DNA primase [Acidobacteriota bacterium]|nr:DNA primase [Acidobacteriota bacterium]
MPTGENFLAQLKAVVDPMMVFGHYITFKKSGSRYRALCPFHTEKTPSFYAADNGMFHCFGCGVGGDVIKFVMLMEKMDFKECMQLLSARYNIPLKFTSGGERKEKEELLDLMRQASDFFYNLLTTHETGKEALDYLEQRGITRETIRKFRLGWAPDSWNALIEHFHKHDVNAAKLEQCGLAIPRQSEGYYDRYRSRIMIPIHDIHGNIIGFGGRIFKGNGEEAKYLNSPETSLYSKSHQLFGLYFSKEHIQEQKFAILVEGYFDLIVPFQSGHTNIVASLGTSLTENQARLLRRYADRVVLLYDPDLAGKTAALRAIPILLKEGFAVQIVTLPDGFDPDQFIRERGADALSSELNTALRYDQLFMNNLAKKHDLKAPSGKLAATDELIGLLAVITNPFEREQLLNRFASSFGISTQILLDLYKRKQKIRSIESRSLKTESNVPKPEKELLQILLMNPGTASEVFSQLNSEDYEELSLADCFTQLQQEIEDNPHVSSAELIHRFPGDLQSLMTSLAMDQEAPDPTVQNALDKIRSIRLIRKDRMLRNLNMEIEDAMKGGDSTKLDALLTMKRELGLQTKGPKPNL